MFNNSDYLNNTMCIRKIFCKIVDGIEWRELKIQRVILKYYEYLQNNIEKCKNEWYYGDIKI